MHIGLSSPTGGEGPIVHRRTAELKGDTVKPERYYAPMIYEDPPPSFKKERTVHGPALDMAGKLSELEYPGTPPILKLGWWHCDFKVLFGFIAVPIWAPDWVETYPPTVSYFVRQIAELDHKCEEASLFDATGPSIFEDLEEKRRRWEHLRVTIDIYKPTPITKKEGD